MADAKIITYGEAFSATTDVVPDNLASALAVQNVDGKTMINLETTDNNESIELSPVGNWDALGFKIDKAADNFYVKTGTQWMNMGSTLGGATLSVGSTNGFIQEYLSGVNTYWQVVDGTSPKLRVNKDGTIIAGNVTTSMGVSPGSLHIYTGSSSLGSASTAADDLVIEGSSHPGMTILSGGTDQLGSIFFADDGSNGSGWVRYNHNGDSMAVKSAGYTFFETGGENERMRILSTGFVGVGDTAPTSMIGIKGSLGTALSSGTVSTSGSSTTLTGSSTAFETDFSVGAAIKVGSVTTTVTAIADDTTLTLEDSINTGATGTACTRDPSLFQIQTGDGKEALIMNGAGNLIIGPDVAATDAGATDSGQGKQVMIQSDLRNILSLENTSGHLRHTFVEDSYQLSAGSGSSRVKISAGTDGSFFRYTALNLGYEQSTTEGQLHVMVGTSDTAGGGAISMVNNRHCIKCEMDDTSNNPIVVDLANTGTGDAIKYAGPSSKFFHVKSDGDCENTNNSYGGISDRRLKENITDATSKLSDLNKLQVRNFNFIGDDLKQIGLVADEVAEVFPALVKSSDARTYSRTESMGDDGELQVEKELIGGLEDQKSVKYSVLVPMLIKAVQELSARIEELENGD